MNFNRLDMFKFSFMTSAFFSINSVGSSLSNMFGVTARSSNSSPWYVEGRLFIKHSNSNNVSFNSEKGYHGFPTCRFYTALNSVVNPHSPYASNASKSVVQNNIISLINIALLIKHIICRTI